MRNDSAIRFAAMLATLAVAGMLAIACGQGGEPTGNESGGDSSQPSGSSNPSQDQSPTRNNNTSASNRTSQSANTSPAATSAGQRGDDRGAPAVRCGDAGSSHGTGDPGLHGQRPDRRAGSGINGAGRFSSRRWITATGTDDSSRIRRNREPQ